MNGYDLEHLTHDLDTMFVEEQPPRLFLESAAECLRKLVSGLLFLDERQLKAKGTPRRHVMYVDPRWW